MCHICPSTQIMKWFAQRWPKAQFPLNLSLNPKPYEVRWRTEALRVFLEVIEVIGSRGLSLQGGRKAEVSFLEPADMGGGFPKISSGGRIVMLRGLRWSPPISGDYSMATVETLTIICARVMYLGSANSDSSKNKYQIS